MENKKRSANDQTVIFKRSRTMSGKPWQPFYGENIEHICLMNYMFELNWLFDECFEILTTVPVLLFHGQRGIHNISLPNVSMCQIDLGKEIYGTHHSKIILIFYKNGIRIVISTANMIKCDYNFKDQGIFIQDFPLKDANTCLEETDFEIDLINYMKEIRLYSNKIQTVFDEKIIRNISKYDFTSAEVILICSVPGRHLTKHETKWGHLKLKRILIENNVYETLEDNNTAISMQCSSLGSMKKNENYINEVARSMHKTSDSIAIIWPTVEFVRCSLEGYDSGRSLPCGEKTIFTSSNSINMKEGFRRHLHKYQSTHNSISSNDIVSGNIDPSSKQPSECRSDVGSVTAVDHPPSPHIKSYCTYQLERIDNTDHTASTYSPRIPSLNWFLLTSSNLSQAAWGVLEKSGTILYIKSYEIGVLFLPNKVKTTRRVFSCTPAHPLLGLDTHSLSQHDPPCKASRKPSKFLISSTECSYQDHELEQAVVHFPLPYLLPSVPYSASDTPWTWDIRHSRPDRFGHSYPSDS